MQMMQKTDFLRRMSHDIRTPINVIMGMVAIGNRFPDDPQNCNIAVIRYNQPHQCCLNW